MSQLMLEELQRDEATIRRAQIGHRLAWPEIVALIIAAWGVRFAMGLLA